MYQSIYEFAQAIDEAAWYYRVGQIQKLRKTLRGLGCQAGSGIFQIHRLDDNERDYAYHWGGRDECQFNIRFIRGRKHNYIEYGLAFSLESIRGFSVVENMRPKIERFNKYIRLHHGDFKDYRIAVNREVYSKVVDEKKQRAYPLVSQNTKIPQPREKGHAHARIYPIRSRKYSARYTE